MNHVADVTGDHPPAQATSETNPCPKVQDRRALGISVGAKMVWVDSE
jgi:hypothetical protein